MRIRITDASIAAIPAPTDVPQLYAWDTELAGFGCVIGRRARTYVYNHRASGDKRRTAIGRAGEWTADSARAVARQMRDEQTQAPIAPRSQPQRLPSGKWRIRHREFGRRASATFATKAEAEATLVRLAARPHGGSLERQQLDAHDSILRTLLARVNELESRVAQLEGSGSKRSKPVRVLWSDD